MKKFNARADVSVLELSFYEIFVLFMLLAVFQVNAEVRSQETFLY